MKIKTYLRIANVVQAVHDVLSCDGVILGDPARIQSHNVGTLIFPSLECLIREAAKALYPQRKKLPQRTIKLLAQYTADKFDLDVSEPDPVNPLDQEIPLDPIVWLQESCILEDELQNFVYVCEDDLAGVITDEGEL